jgi:hypothetical protein
LTRASKTGIVRSSASSIDQASAPDHVDACYQNNQKTGSEGFDITSNTADPIHLHQVDSAFTSAPQDVLLLTRETPNLLIQHALCAQCKVMPVMLSRTTSPSPPSAPVPDPKFTDGPDTMTSRAQWPAFAILRTVEPSPFSASHAPWPTTIPDTAPDYSGNYSFCSFSLVPLDPGSRSGSFAPNDSSDSSDSSLPGLGSCGSSDSCSGKLTAFDSGVFFTA